MVSWLSQLVCVNLTLYHTRVLYILYPLMLPLGQPVPACVWEHSLCIRICLQFLHLPGTMSSVHSLKLGIHLKGWEWYGITSSVCILISFTMKVVKTKQINLFSWFSHCFSHVQLKNANLMGQVVSSRGTFPISLTSLYYCKGKAVKFFSCYYIFQRITFLPGLRLCLTSFSAIWVLYAWAINQGTE